MYILIGVLIGMIVAFPVGPLGLLNIQRTLKRGRKIGFLSGVGAAASDFIYSSIAVLGASFMNDLITKHRFFIKGITGVLFLIVGINIMMSAINSKGIKSKFIIDEMHPFFSNFFLGLSNPMTFILFLAIFTRIGLGAKELLPMQLLLFVFSIFLGSAILWLGITNIIEKSKRDFKFESFLFMDKVVGIIFFTVGLYSMIRYIFRF